jgi:hypothetical protein
MHRCPFCGDPCDCDELQRDDDGIGVGRDCDHDCGADDEDDFDCGMDRHGNCGKAGSEECDWECPNGRSIKN